jgi:hypothetical protein
VKDQALLAEAANFQTVLLAFGDSPVHANFASKSDFKF